MAIWKNAVVVYAIISTAMAGTLQRRDFSTVRADLGKIDANVTSSLVDCQKYNGTNEAAVKFIIADLYYYIESIKQGTKDCQNTAATSVTAAQANATNTYSNNPLEPDIKKLTTCMINQKAKVGNNAYLLSGQLKWIQGNTTQLNNCIVNKTPTAQKAAASSVTSKINADIASAVAAYP